MSAKLVLWKPRAQRIAEYFIFPLVLLPVGPVMRNLLGNAYVVELGFAAAFALIILSVLGGRLWAQGHGGEWVAPAERMQRLFAELASAPRWQTALTRAVCYALTFIAMILIIAPADEFGLGFGGPAVLIGFVALVSLIMVIPLLTGKQQRLMSSIVVEQTEVPSSRIWSEQFRLLPRSYLATLIATIAGFFAGSQFTDTLRMAVFAIVTLGLLQLLRQLPFFGKAPKRVYPSFGRREFGNYLLLGILCWGIPYAIMFSGYLFILVGDEPFAVFDSVALTILVALLGGALMGGFLYLNNRIGQRRAAGETT